ncbi:FliM/FliN family flagellar motor C-terminal domain-containing protein [Pleionea sp. CnH1-48]|uniref:FliM/FliN family flagellar motor switch protein n=1 Tax=Pleionea sp. CnH1-48 TaxID=2954494 RepID=UPI0020971D2B|nr:FliM/FliN family flagellar motor C-terminal domain-containing protein [Pleionea sp. CnH1-48]MCO7223704.1 FliM/FliN family flagellar motor C-terminal domain-containing protein [Pleionea sp. CnH1-48]
MDINEIELKEIKEDELSVSGDKVVEHQSIINELDIQLSVVVGTTHLTVGELYSLTKGQLLVLEQKSEEPVKLYYKDKLVALGELVATEEHFAIKLTEVADK